MRPNATAVPTPVARTGPGYTCAASAYIVVCTPLISPPRTVSNAMIERLSCGDSDMRLNVRAQTTAAAAIDNIDPREPAGAIATPPASAPTTPPRLNAVIPVLADDGVKPAPLRRAVNQLKPE